LRGIQALAGAAVTALGPFAAIAGTIGAWMWWWDRIKDIPPSPIPTFPNMPNNRDGSPRPRLSPASTVPMPNRTAEQRARLGYMGLDPQTTLDHIIPLAKGGGHVWTNIQPACQRCNSSKCDRTR
jgi:hypothetical protein